MESILTSIKKLLGVVEEDTNFDTDIIMHINSVFSILTQLGVGPSEGFSISDSYTTWTKFTKDAIELNPVKTYMHLKVKLLFDPPLSSNVLSAMERQISELEWRLNAASDFKPISKEGAGE